MLINIALNWVILGLIANPRIKFKTDVTVNECITMYRKLYNPRHSCDKLC